MTWPNWCIAVLTVAATVVGCGSGCGLRERLVDVKADARAELMAVIRDAVRVELMARVQATAEIAKVEQRAEAIEQEIAGLKVAAEAGTIKQYAEDIRQQIAGAVASLTANITAAVSATVETQLEARTGGQDQSAGRDAIVVNNALWPLLLVPATILLYRLSKRSPTVRAVYDGLAGKPAGVQDGNEKA